MKRILPLLIMLVSWSISHAAEFLELSALKNLYEAVQFSHDAHVEYVGGECGICHHYSEDLLPCAECHKPFSVYRYEGPRRTTSLGLKGAYHGQCLGCHREAGGPVGCEDCHSRVEKRP